MNNINEHLILTHGSLSVDLSYILELNHSNFIEWNEQILITLLYLQLDLALQVKKLLLSSNNNIFDVKTFYKK